VAARSRIRVWTPRSFDRQTTHSHPEGGIRLLEGNLGRSFIKSSAVSPEHLSMTAPAVVISHQDELKYLFERGELDRDCVIVARFQGPALTGCPSYIN
jgi:phosphogluconate dehydratase